MKNFLISLSVIILLSLTLINCHGRMPQRNEAELKRLQDSVINARLFADFSFNGQPVNPAAVFRLGITGGDTVIGLDTFHDYHSNQHIMDWISNTQLADFYISGEEKGWPPCLEYHVAGETTGGIFILLVQSCGWGVKNLYTTSVKVIELKGGKLRCLYMYYYPRDYPLAITKNQIIQTLPDSIVNVDFAGEFSFAGQPISPLAVTLTDTLDLRKYPYDDSAFVDECHYTKYQRAPFIMRHTWMPEYPAWKNYHWPIIRDSIAYRVAGKTANGKFVVITYDALAIRRYSTGYIEMLDLKAGKLMPSMFMRYDCHNLLEIRGNKVIQTLPREIYPIHE